MPMRRVMKGPSQAEVGHGSPERSVAVDDPKPSQRLADARVARVLEATDTAALAAKLAPEIAGALTSRLSLEVLRDRLMTVPVDKLVNDDELLCQVSAEVVSRLN